MKIRPMGAELLHADGQTEIQAHMIEAGGTRTQARVKLYQFSKRHCPSAE
jgi:hypothetical protein